MLNELSLSGAKEVVVATSFDDVYQQRIRERQVVAISFEDDERVKDVFQPLFIEEMEEKQKIAMARLFNYLYRTQKRSLDHLQPVSLLQNQPLYEN